MKSTPTFIWLRYEEHRFSGSAAPGTLNSAPGGEVTKWCTPGQHVLCVNEYVISVLFCPRSIHGPRVGCIMSHCSCLSVARIPFCSNEQPGPRLTFSNHDILGRKYFLCPITIPSITSTHGVGFRVLSPKSTLNSSQLSHNFIVAKLRQTLRRKRST